MVKESFKQTSSSGSELNYLEPGLEGATALLDKLAMAPDRFGLFFAWRRRVTTFDRHDKTDQLCN